MAGQASRRWRVDVCAAACIHDPLDDVGLEPLQEQVLREVGVGRETNDAADELGICLSEPYGYPPTNSGADEHDAAVVVRRGNRFDQLLRIGEPLRETSLLDVTLGTTHAVVIGHDEAIFVLAAPGPQARTHRVDLRQRERRQEHLCANQPVSLGAARSERRIATPSSRRRVDGVQVIMIQPRDVEKRHDI